MTDYNEVWYSSEDELRLCARDYPYLGSAETDGLTAICVPGLTRNSADFHDLCLVLQQRCRAIAMDLRGRGRSQYDSQPENYQPGTYVKDLQSLVETLGLPKVVLVGTSLGGLISILVGATRPSWLQAVVINDFGPELEQAGLERIKSYVGKSAPVNNWREAVAQCKAINGSELPNLSDEQWLAFARNIYREDASGRPVLAYDPAIARPFEGNEAVASAEPLWRAFEAMPPVPVLLIRGELSDLLGASCVEEMCRRRKDLRFVEVPDRGHAPLLNEPSALEAIQGLLDTLC